MTLNTQRLHAVVDLVIGNMDHPDAPELKVKDYRAHVTAAAMMRNPDSVRPQDVVQMFHLLKRMDMSPADFEDAWSMARPIANRFLDRDPTPQEIKRFHGVTPGEIHDYYSEHPMPGHEEVKAGNYIKYFHAARPIAHSTVGRNPLPVEIARFAAAGYDAEDMHAHYTQKGKG